MALQQPKDLDNGPKHFCSMQINAKIRAVNSDESILKYAFNVLCLRKKMNEDDVATHHCYKNGYDCSNEPNILQSLINDGDIIKDARSHMLISQLHHL